MMVQKNKNKLIIIISLINFVSCFQENNINFFSLQKRDGKYYDRITGALYSGKCYDNGKFEGIIIDGLQDGVWRYYFPNKDLVYKSQEFIMGKKNGKEILYSEDGDTISITNYKNDIKNGLFTYYGGTKHIIYSENNVNGLREGEYILYYANSKVVKEKGHYSNDEPSGKWYLYDSIGNIESVVLKSVGSGQN